MHEEQASLFLLYVSRIARARTDDVSCVHYISKVHSCDVRRALWKYNELVLTDHGARISLNIFLNSHRASSNKPIRILVIMVHII